MTARWRGLKALAQAAALQASVAIERVQKETARRPLALLSLIPRLAPHARTVHAIHDAAVSGVHGAIRLVTRAVGGTLDLVLDATGGGGGGGGQPGDTADPKGRG